MERQAARPPDGAKQMMNDDAALLLALLGRHVDALPASSSSQPATKTSVERSAWSPNAVAAFPFSTRNGDDAGTTRPPPPPTPPTANRAPATHRRRRDIDTNHNYDSRPTCYATEEERDDASRPCARTTLTTAMMEPPIRRGDVLEQADATRGDAVVAAATVLFREGNNGIDDDAQVVERKLPTIEPMRQGETRATTIRRGPPLSSPAEVLRSTRDDAMAAQIFSPKRKKCSPEEPMRREAPATSHQSPFLSYHDLQDEQGRLDSIAQQMANHSIGRSPGNRSTGERPFPPLEKQAVVRDRTVGRIRRYDAQRGAYGAWEDIRVASSSPGGDGSQSVRIDLNRGGKVCVYPSMLPQERRNSLSTAMHQCKLYRQYTRSEVFHEPRFHVLLSSKANSSDSGYMYHGIKMKALPMDLVPEVKSYAHELAGFYGLPKNRWDIGVDLIVYKDGNDSIGWHADDTQGESVVLCVVVDAPGEPRPVYVRPNKRARRLADGDEEVQLYVGEGDAYDMDGTMQAGYEHSLPKKKGNRSHRFVLIFRHGDEASVADDSGVAITEIAARKKVILQTATTDGADNENLISVLSRLRPKRPLVRFGHPRGVSEGSLYSRRFLYSINAHGADQRGVNGNVRLGSDSIVVSRQSSDCREEDGLQWLRYTSNRRQGGGALCLSHKQKSCIRVFRSSNLKSGYAPPELEGSRTSYRYDGLYIVTEIWNSKGNSMGGCNVHIPAGGAQYTFHLTRLPKIEAPFVGDNGNMGNSMNVDDLWKNIQRSHGRQSGDNFVSRCPRHIGTLPKLSVPASNCATRSIVNRGSCQPNKETHPRASAAVPSPDTTKQKAQLAKSDGLLPMRANLGRFQDEGHFASLSRPSFHHVNSNSVPRRPLSTLFDAHVCNYLLQPSLQNRHVPHKSPYRANVTFPFLRAAPCDSHPLHHHSQDGPSQPCHTTPNSTGVPSASPPDQVCRVEDCDRRRKSEWDGYFNAHFRRQSDLGGMRYKEAHPHRRYKAEGCAKHRTAGCNMYCSKQHRRTHRRDIDEVDNDGVDIDGTVSVANFGENMNHAYDHHWETSNIVGVPLPLLVELPPEAKLSTQSQIPKLQVGNIRCADQQSKRDHNFPIPQSIIDPTTSINRNIIEMEGEADHHGPKLLPRRSQPKKRFELWLENRKAFWRYHIFSQAIANETKRLSRNTIEIEGKTNCHDPKLRLGHSHPKKGTVDFANPEGRMLINHADEFNRETSTLVGVSSSHLSTPLVRLAAAANPHVQSPAVEYQVGNTKEIDCNLSMYQVMIDPTALSHRKTTEMQSKADHHGPKLLPRRSQPKRRFELWLENRKAFWRYHKFSQAIANETKRLSRNTIARVGGTNRYDPKLRLGHSHPKRGFESRHVDKMNRKDQQEKDCKDVIDQSDAVKRQFADDWENMTMEQLGQYRAAVAVQVTNDAIKEIETYVYSVILMEFWGKSIQITRSAIRELETFSLGAIGAIFGGKFPRRKKTRSNKDLAKKASNKPTMRKMPTLIANEGKNSILSKRQMWQASNAAKAIQTPRKITPRFTTIENECMQSLSPSLEASVQIRRGTIKKMKVTVKWLLGSPRINGKYEKQTSGIIESQVMGKKRKELEVEPVPKKDGHRRKSPRLSNVSFKAQNLSKEKVADDSNARFNANDRVFAWDRGHLYEAKVIKCKYSAGVMKYLIHYLGYKRSHNKWLLGQDMTKNTSSSRKFYEDCRTWPLEDNQNVSPASGIEKSDHSNDLTKNKDTRGQKRKMPESGRAVTTKFGTQAARRKPRLVSKDPEARNIPQLRSQTIGYRKNKNDALKTSNLPRNNLDLTIAGAALNNDSALLDGLQTKSENIGPTDQVPGVGMIVDVKFDGGKIYRGKITNVRAQRKKSLQGKGIYSIQIHYDDGDVENAIYPDPGISLVPNSLPLQKRKTSQFPAR